MVKYHIDNWITRQVQDMSVFQDLTEEEHERLYNEIKNATLQGLDDKLKDWFHSGEKKDNNVQSLLLWVLGLVYDKPIKHQKIKSEGSYADVDQDFEKNKREEVISYLREKYGKDRTCQVATFGTMAAKGAIRNAARALGYSTELQNKVAKFIPELPGISIQDSIDSNKDFQSLIEKDKDVKHIIETALKLEGLPNSIGTHPSGFIITDTCTTDYFPVMIASRKDTDCIISQFEYYDVEASGNLKWDILALKTLDILNKTICFIKTYKNIDINLYNIDVNDKGIYKLLDDGHVEFIFQFDGAAAAYLQTVKPENINEISDLTSINRMVEVKVGYMLESPNLLGRIY